MVTKSCELAFGGRDTRSEHQSKEGQFIYNSTSEKQYGQHIPCCLFILRVSSQGISMRLPTLSILQDFPLSSSP